MPRTTVDPNRRAVFALASLVLLIVIPGRLAAEAEAPAVAEAARQFERNVVENIQNQPVGRHTVRDYGFPEDYLERLADYEIRWGFQVRHHRVYRDVPEKDTTEIPGTKAGEGATDWIRILRVETASSTLEYRRSFTKERPGLRGFRAPVLDRVGRDWPINLPDAATEKLKLAEETTARHLAPDGLLATVVRVLEALGPKRFLSPDDAALGELRAVGLPLDLLEHFPLPGGEREPAKIVAAIARRLTGEIETGSLAAELTQIPFRFVKTRSDFVAATESGENDLGLLRLQLARGTYWRGQGSGDSVDMARQLAQALPDVPLLVTLESKHLDAFVNTARGWSHRVPDRLTVVAEPLEVTQWAQDNGKAGWIGRAATLVPRFASKRNDGSEFVSGDSYLVDGLQAAGHAVFQSPLLFQGGNLLVVSDPARSERVLLISEAEIYRNTALGLTENQVEEAFRVELAVDRVVVLPVVAFHLDYDLTTRVHDGKLLIFVNDVDQAVRTILELGIGALTRAQALGPAAQTTALQHLREGQDAELVRLLKPIIWKLMTPEQAFPQSVADHFSVSDVDSGVGNLQRFLVALDVLTSRSLPESELPQNGQVRAYLASFRRTATARDRLHDRLRSLGFRVEPIPSFPFEERSITYLNGIHDRAHYLMPAYGGLYEPLDREAQAAFRRVLGEEVEIIGILSSESQRRSGAVHCSAAAYPLECPTGRSRCASDGTGRTP